MGAPHLLVLNAAEGVLQLVLARLAEGASSPAPGTSGSVSPSGGACGEEPAIVTAQSWNVPSQGAELLAPALENALARLGLVPKNIRRIACVRGPGSFTGLRLVLATASGLARAAGAELAGLDYLPLLAVEAACLRSRCGVFHPVSDGGKEDGDSTPLYWVLTHARRNLVHMQGFEEVPPAFAAAGTEADPATGNAPGAGGGICAGTDAGAAARTKPEAGHPALRACTDILVLSPAEAARRISAAEKTPVLLGSGLTRNLAHWRELFPLLGRAPLALPEVCDAPGSRTLVRAAHRAVYGTGDIAPLYARPCDAEENLESIARSLGLDPQAARQRLADLTDGPAAPGLREPPVSGGSPLSGSA